MKIYYVANARMPTSKAHGIQLAKMTEAMLASGADLELVLPRRKNIKKSIKEYYGLNAEIPERRLPILDVYNYGKAGFYLGSFSFMLAYFFYLLLRKLMGEKFVIYTVDMDRFSFLFLPFLGAPIFAEIHDSKPDLRRFKMFFKKARGIVVINNIIKKEICKNFGIEEAKIIVCPNGIDLDMFSGKLTASEARAKLGMPQNKKIALYSGKFYDWKGLDILIGAANLLAERAMIYMVGGSEEKFKGAIGLVAEQPTNLICAGEKPYKDMPLWLQAADIFLVLGTKKNEYSYQHTSPMKLMEYMASRRPIVASRTPANLEIIAEGEAIFYEPDNAMDLAEKVSHVLENKNNFQAMLGRAYNKAEKLSWNKRAESVIKFIESRSR